MNVSTKYLSSEYDKQKKKRKQQKKLVKKSEFLQEANF